MEISQHDTMSIVIILESHRMKTMAVEISQHQFSICQKANGEFCNINAPLQLFANPLSFITAQYATNCSQYHC